LLPQGTEADATVGGVIVSQMPVRPAVARTVADATTIIRRSRRVSALNIFLNLAVQLEDPLNIRLNIRRSPHCYWA
jgi:hypothetical protein